MRVSAKADYALRALIEIAVRSDGSAVSAEQLGKAQDIPHGFLQAILADLRRAGIVVSQRGQSGGWRFARGPETVTVADVIRAVDGPLVSVYGLRPEAVAYNESAQVLQHVWIAARSSLRGGLRAGLDPGPRRRHPAARRSPRSPPTRTPGSRTEGADRFAAEVPAPAGTLAHAGRCIGQQAEDRPATQAASTRVSRSRTFRRCLVSLSNRRSTSASRASRTIRASSVPSASTVGSSPTGSTWMRDVLLHVRRPGSEEVGR